jgi:hypothetical protein
VKSLSIEPRGLVMCCCCIIIIRVFFTYKFYCGIEPRGFGIDFTVGGGDWLNAAWRPSKAQDTAQSG